MTKPDWEAFGRAVVGMGIRFPGHSCKWPGLYDLEASEVFDLAKAHGLIREIPGGFDPERHEDFYGVGLEEGDPYFTFTFDPI